MFLKDNTKMKWFANDIENGYLKFNDNKISLEELMNNDDNSAVLHFILRYKNSFIIYDIALVDNKKKNNKYKYTNYLSYYNNEWFYILKDVINIMKNSNNRYKKEMNEINALLDKYDIIKQINMQLYYLKYIVSKNLITRDDLQTYLEFIIKNILNEINYDDTIIDQMLDFINADYNDVDDVDDVEKSETLVKMINDLNFNVFEYVNNKLKKPAIHYIAMLYQKPKYYYLANNKI